ncbi:putative methyltransferase NSUN7 [Prorops nasuta]|uniref:putative methyltransferase NSUN7 n=1 Tax=Prorops nasuta TaxID=863751 RepID=UPI0034CF7F87
MCKRRANIFAIYARAFRILLAKLSPKMKFITEEQRTKKELEDLVLPSNEDWRHQVYYSLVELQREFDAETSSRTMNSKVGMENKIWNEWKPEERKYPLKAKRATSLLSTESLTNVLRIDGSMTETCVEPGWRLNDIILAARVLQKSHPSPIYANEAEMRRVFGLVYDVLRYKNILRKALANMQFWQKNNSLKEKERVVWLLLYDLQARRFARLGDDEAIEMRMQTFEAAGLKRIEEALLRNKTRLAASISRLRIAGSALSLDELLPSHLRIAGGINWGNEPAIASGFVNALNLKTKHEYVLEMSRLGLYPCLDCSAAELDEEHFTWDPICPRMINLHENAREKLAVSGLVQSRRFVFLERSLCLGAAVVAQAIRNGRLCGPVILTHSIAPRHTAYLANLLTDIEGAGRLLAFGAGQKRYEYEKYLKKLGITLQQCRVYSEKYMDPPPLAELNRATVVLASPPCSYTGLRDIVDLAVARDGDAALLEALTDPENEKQPKAFLSDQMSTLKYALTRPNVQLLIYEVHTILSTETTEMIQQVVEYANKMALQKHTHDRPIKRKTPSKEIPVKTSRSNRSLKSGQDRREQIESSLDISNDDDKPSIIPNDIKVPDSDLFEIGNIDEICGLKTSGMLHPGCFLAVVKRKEMMQFNSLFMIKEAEARGLFGNPGKQKLVMKEENLTVRRLSQDSKRGNRRRSKIEIDRIAAPTHTFMVRVKRLKETCPRLNKHNLRQENSCITQVQHAKRLEARRRWSEAISFIMKIGSSQQHLKNKFKLTRIDPFTQRTLYSPRVSKLLFPQDYESVKTA